MIAAIAARVVWSSRRTGWLLLAVLVGVILILRIANAYGVWRLLPLVAVVVLLLWRLTLDDPPRSRIVVGCALLLLGFSFGLHAVIPKVDSLTTPVGHTWAFQIKSMLKHSAELAGWMLLATGLVAASCSELQSAESHAAVPRTATDPDHGSELSRPEPLDI